MVTTTTLPTLVRVTKSRERPEKVVRVTKEKAQLCRSGEAERALEGRDGKSLDKAFQQYLEYRTVKEPIMEDNRWRNVLKLQTLLTRPEYANIYLAGREHALYEELHRSNPERFVSKSRFMVIMRRVFGFELAPVRGAVDADVKELIENVYDAFDERGNDKMEWRGILLMLHVVLKPWLPPVAHFSWGFAMVGSEGSFDPTCSEPFDARLASLKHMLFTLGHVKSRPMLTRMVDDTWAELCRVDKRAAALTRNAEAMSWQRPAGTCFCAGCDAQFCAVVCNDTNRKLCMDCYNATHAEKSEDEFNALTFKILKGGDPESGRADIQALEDTGKRLEEERAKQEEEARVARRQSVRRQSSLGRQSAVGAELAKLKSRQSLAAGTPEADALAEVLAGRAEPDEGEEMLDRTQRETSELMAIVEERARRRARRDAGEADEDPAGKRPMLEYRKARRRPSELLRIANGEPDDATTATGNEDKSLVPSTITGGESLDAPGDSLASSLIDALDSFPDPPSEDGGGVKPPRPS